MTGPYFFCLYVFDFLSDFYVKPLCLLTTGFMKGVRRCL